MKYLFLLCSLIPLWVLTSCSDELETPVVTDLVTRSLEYGGDYSVSNPGLLTDWENVEEIVLNEGSKFFSPWKMNFSGTTLPYSFCMDVKKEDGWVMLFHTMREVNLQPGQNYMCFYNRLTGFIKVFYCFDGDPSLTENLYWFVKTDAARTTRLFNLSEYISKPDAESPEHDQLVFSNLIDGDVKGLSKGWNGFEFQVPYCEDYRDLIFYIGAFDKKVTQIEMTGKEVLQTSGTITPIGQLSDSGTSGEDEKKDGVVNIGKEDATNFVDVLSKGVEVGSRINEAIKEFKSGKIISALKKGLGWIFGSTSQSNAWDVNLTTNGEITLSGEMSSQSMTAVVPVRFNLYDIMNATAETANTRSVETEPAMVYNQNEGSQFLGVWTVSEKPTIAFERLAHILSPKLTPTGVGNTYQVQGQISVPVINKREYQVVLNPTIRPYVKSYQTHIDFITQDGANSVFNLLPTKPLYGSFIETEGYMIDLPPGGFYSIESPNVGNCACFFDWGDITNAHYLAIVSVEINFEYQGKETTVYQSRTYKVNYEIDENSAAIVEAAHHPPYAFVINYGRPFFYPGYFPAEEFWY